MQDWLSNIAAQIIANPLEWWWAILMGAVTTVMGWWQTGQFVIGAVKSTNKFLTRRAERIAASTRAEQSRKDGIDMLLKEFLPEMAKGGARPVLSPKRRCTDCGFVGDEIDMPNHRIPGKNLICPSKTCGELIWVKNS